MTMQATILRTAPCRQERAATLRFFVNPFLHNYIESRETTMVIGTGELRL